MTQKELSDELYEVWMNLKQKDKMFDTLAEFVLANFTPKGEATEELAERIYLIVIDRVSQNSSRHLNSLPELAKYAHEAAKAFREFKPE